jgi:hypothetical protein
MRLTDSSGGGTVVGDFNGNGLSDVAAANGGNAFGGSVGIYLGKGKARSSRGSLTQPSSTL